MSGPVQTEHSVSHGAQEALSLVRSAYVPDGQPVAQLSFGDLPVQFPQVKLSSAVVKPLGQALTHLCPVATYSVGHASTQVSLN